MVYTQAAMELVDTHCHLTFPPLATNLGNVIERARERGVTRIVVPAYDLASWDAIERISNREGIYPALGLHPWAAYESIDLGELERRLDGCGAVAIGEIGLDFKIDAVSPELQLDVLMRQLEIASRLDLPVLLHCRSAFEELLSVLNKFNPGLRCVLHAYSRGTDLASRFLEAGVHLAFGGAVTRPRAKRARSSAAKIPLDRLLLETDAPSIGLEGVDPENVEPHHVADIAWAVAQARDESLEEIAKATTENAKQLFGMD
ncbi:MAG: TatD family hydrolase [Deltaproteobacteria bacterium]|nr:TatD family hydrolase [Deltaproteobacteria bacterium]